MKIKSFERPSRSRDDKIAITRVTKYARFQQHENALRVISRVNADIR